MPAPSNASQYGIAKEGTKGTAVAATDFIPWKTFNPFDNKVFLPDTGMRGAAVDQYDDVEGVWFTEVDWGGDVFPDTIGYLLSGVLGDVATTGASAPFTHAMALKNSGDQQPTAFTLTDFDGLVTQARQYPGQQVSDLTMRFNADGMFEYSGKSLGYKSVLATKPTASYSSITPLPAWLGVTTVGGSTVNYLETFEIGLKRPVRPIHTADGTQDPKAIWVGPLSVDGKITYTADDEAELLRYLNTTKPSLDVDFTQGAAAALVEVKLHMTKVTYKNTKVTRGADQVRIETDFKAEANTTDVGASGGYSPLKVTLKNAKPAATYA